MRTAVLVSGSGTILATMFEAGIPIALVVTDRDCPALEVARSNGVEALLVKRESFGSDFDRDGYTETVTSVLVAHDIELVAMAGYGTVFGQPIYDRFEGRILNTHPALLPSFPGWHAVADALAYGVHVTGCTVHIATLEVDAGPILAQDSVRVRPGDSVESLHERIKVVERRLYIQTIKEILDRGAVLPPVS